MCNRLHCVRCTYLMLLIRCNRLPAECNRLPSVCNRLPAECNRLHCVNSPKLPFLAQARILQYSPGFHPPIFAQARISRSSEASRTDTIFLKIKIWGVTTKCNAAPSPEYSLMLCTNAQLRYPPSPPTLGSFNPKQQQLQHINLHIKTLIILESRSSEDRLAWARTHDSSHHAGTDALARATFSRPGEIRPVAAPLSRLSELHLAQAIIPGKYLGTTLSPSLGRAPLAQARITQWTKKAKDIQGVNFQQCELSRESVKTSRYGALSDTCRVLCNLACETEEDFSEMLEKVCNECSRLQSKQHSSLMENVDNATEDQKLISVDLG
ncbi:hypothetical protein Lal_00018862 [Lupinus albus]|nr:hypothetical protein Lal_00018862 [Lupinus albus]